MPSQSVLPLMDLDILRTFVTICESGNFSRAAERVHRTPSAVSLQIKKLEEQVGRELFIREPRRAIPTTEADHLLVYARRILQLNAEAMRLFHVPPMSGKVRFGAVDDLSNGSMAEIMQRFATTHPDVELEIYLDRSVVLEEQFLNGELDVVVNMSCKEDTLHAQQLFSEELAWVGNRNFRIPKDAPLPLVVVGYNCRWTAMAAAALDEAGVSHRLAYTCPQLQSMLTAVQAGLAVAVLPVSAVPDDCVILNDFLPPIGTYNLYLFKRPDASDAVEALHDHLLQLFEKHPAKSKRLFG